MATHLVMDQSGHRCLEFDVKDATALAAAEKRFRELTGLGFTAASRLPDGTAQVVRNFDPSVEETMFVPHLVGG